MKYEKVMCACCGKQPKDILEYQISYEAEGFESAEAMAMEDGTYNSKTNLFVCTDCYIKKGMPNWYGGGLGRLTSRLHTEVKNV